MVTSEEKGWIGVDLDGTLFEYHGWTKWNEFGAPIGRMVQRVQNWFSAGREVRIVTARVGLPLQNGKLSGECNRICYKTGETFSDLMMARAIQQHCMLHALPLMAVQCYKDLYMLELWDDRAVQVVANTGHTLSDSHAAEIAALSGKSYGSETR